ncbi:MAG: hypothetical protein AB1758_34850, partial [Candidatus Eremiobacterota bacterium]
METVKQRIDLVRIGNRDYEVKKAFADVAASSLLTPATAKKTTDNGANYTTYASGANVVLNSLDTLANGDWLVVGLDHEFRGLKVAIDAANANAATLAVHYWNGSAWTAVSNLSDGSASGGATLAQAGNITWDYPTNWAASTIDGVTAYYVRLSVSAALDADTQVDLTAI